MDMKNLILASVLAILAFNVSSQDGEYDKILALIVDEQYEKALYKAEPYTLKDDSKKDALPYLYMSMCYFEMSNRGEYEEKYPKAFKESLKYASKHRKKDVENVFYSEFGDFFSELRERAMAEAEALNDQDKFTTSKGYYQYLVSIDEKDPGATIMLGYVFLKLKSKKDADLNFNKAKQLIEENGTEGLAAEQLRLLKNSVITLSQYMNDQSMGSEARAWLELVKPFFEEEKDFQVVYREIGG